MSLKYYIFASVKILVCIWRWIKHNIISSIQFKNTFKIKFKNFILIVILLLY